MYPQTVTLHPINGLQMNALKALSKALNISFEIKKKSPYADSFVDMVLQAEEGIKQGKSKKVTAEEFDALWK